MTDYTAFTRMLAEEDYGSIQETLAFFLEECSLDQAPAAAEVAAWRDILAARGGRFAKLAALCADYLNDMP